MNINLSTAIKPYEQYYLSNTRFICDEEHTYVKVEEPISSERVRVYKVDYKQFGRFIKELIKFSSKTDKVTKSDLLDFQNNHYETIIEMLKMRLTYDEDIVESNFKINEDREREYDKRHGHWETVLCHGCPSTSWVPDRIVDKQIDRLQSLKSSGIFRCH